MLTTRAALARIPDGSVPPRRLHDVGGRLRGAAAAPAVAAASADCPASRSGACHGRRDGATPCWRWSIPRWGRRSGAHMNPAVTLPSSGSERSRASTRRVCGAAVRRRHRRDGGRLNAHRPRRCQPPVNYVATTRRASAGRSAFVAEIAISFVLMLIVLSVSNTPRIARLHGVRLRRCWSRPTSASRRRSPA